MKLTHQSNALINVGPNNGENNGATNAMPALLSPILIPGYKWLLRFYFFMLESDVDHHNDLVCLEFLWGKNKVYLGGERFFLRSPSVNRLGASDLCCSYVSIGESCSSLP